ncbi:hypothetical protein EVA_21636 [gut metagenome]|uniref:Uncharacterized protein n=1 Tax=gut metagenome TaxID=749906 RepID=J9FKV2_9ZZZZ
MSYLITDLINFFFFTSLSFSILSMNFSNVPALVAVYVKKTAETGENYTS